MPSRAGRRAGYQTLAPALTLALAGGGFAAVAWLWSAGGGALDLTWAPTLDLRLSFRLDALGALYALLATGVGFAVFAYSWRYLPLHLEHQTRPPSDAVRFYGLMVLFMLSMVGLATAQDLILLFVFWDLTAVSSYFLIAYDRHERTARVAALMALLVTGISAVLLLVGSLMLHAEYGTFAIPELIARAEPGPLLTAAGALITVAALAKSAQVPLHFWLPRAMTAPTPVSAYLHSAAMVAAGVLLIGRVYPLLEPSRLLLDALLVIGFASTAVGGVLALTRDDMKQVLAYSTFSQYGYVVAMYGLGGAAGAIGASFYVFTHALAKSGLFLTAGAVTEATGGCRRLSEVGGLARSLPWLAAGSAGAAAGVAALPLTAGFFADELLFKAAAERGAAVAALATAGAALTFAYMARFWGAIFLGPRRRRSSAIPAALVAPVVVLAALGLAGGLIPSPITGLATDAGEVTLAGAASVDVAYHAEASAENLMALGAYGFGGLLLVASRRRLRPALVSFARLGERLGPGRAYEAGLAGINAVSDRIHDLEVRDLRTRVAAVLVPAGALVVLGFLATPTAGAYSVGSLTGDDVALTLVLIFTAAAALAVTVPRDHLTLVVALATVGYGLAVVYAFFGAPDVALVAVLIETVFALLFFGIFALVPREVLQREASIRSTRGRRWRDVSVGVVSGALVFALVWGALSRPTPSEGAGAEHTALTPDAHAKDVVTAILADFRAIDTLGEVTVVAIALVGVVSLLRRGRLW